MRAAGREVIKLHFDKNVIFASILATLIKANVKLCGFQPHSFLISCKVM